MAVIKLSSSGKQLQFISDEGYIYGISVSLIKTHISSNFDSSHFLSLARLPISVSPTRYPASKLYNFDTGQLEEIKKGSPFYHEHNPYNKTTDDSFSKSVRKDYHDSKSFKGDIEEW